MPQPLSPAEHQALARFRQQHGRFWKTRLYGVWLHDSIDPVLRHLRDAEYFGPVGLIDYEPPQRTLAEVA
jgi:hypothetical protein